jgi:OFA family oxalate/formate antiporter-like MFS transporter
VKHNFTSTLNYELPFGKGRKYMSGVNPGANKFIGGWQINMIMLARTGLPFTVSQQQGLLSNGTGNRPNRLANGDLANPTIDRWWDPTAFAQTADNTGTYGSAGRNILRQPNQVNVDFSLIKNTRFWERFEHQFRIEAFNSLNHLQFAGPARTLGASDQGVITSLLFNTPMRQVQLVMKLNFYRTARGGRRVNRAAPAFLPTRESAPVLVIRCGGLRCPISPRNSRLKRYRVLLAGVLINCCLGGVYAWSIFTPALVKQYGLTTGQSSAVFGVAIAMLASLSIVAGRFLDRLGPKLLSAVAGLLFGAGYMVAAYSGGSFWLIFWGAGVLAGAGTGIGYVGPLALGVRWFPRAPGLVTGIAVGGFGAGAILLSRLAENLMARGLTPLDVIRDVGFAYTAVILLASLGMALPETVSTAAPSATTVSQALADRGYRAVLFGMFAGTFGGLLVLGNLKPLLLSTGLDAASAGAAVAYFAAGNAAGRLAWGWIYDHVGWTTIPWSLAALALPLTGLLFVRGTPLLVVALLAGLTFGANFVVYATHVTERFGQPALARLYPVVFLCYGFAGITAPAIGGWVHDATGSFQTAIWGALALALAGAAVTRGQLPANQSKTA